MSQQNRYGLIKLSSKTNKSLSNIKPSIFDDSDSDSDQQTTGKSSHNKYSSALHVKRQQKLDQQKAINEDSKIFEYDSVYESFKSNNESNTSVKPIEKKPKYINNLLKHSDHRKKEQERRVERKIQKERVNEGNTFDDKEQFVTTAYKQKLEEMQSQELEEMKQKQLEEKLEVTKQKDLSGFYRHLLNETVSNENTSDKNLKDTSISDIAVKSPSKPTQPQRNTRQFRKRYSSEESSSSNEVKNPKTKKTKSDDSIEINQTDSVENDESITNKSNQLDLDADDSVDLPEKIEPEIDHSVDNVTADKNVDKQKLLQILFTKRTVGHVFDLARQRYLERKNINNL